VGVVITVCGLLLPTKTTCVEMLVASKVTHENVQIAKEEIYNMIDYIDERFNGEQAKDTESEGE
jgi:hypothetical protein